MTSNSTLTGISSITSVGAYLEAVDAARNSRAHYPAVQETRKVHSLRTGKLGLAASLFSLLLIIAVMA